MDVDTSEQYILMCREAKELQETWQPTEGDWFVGDGSVHTIGDNLLCRGHGGPVFRVLEDGEYNGTEMRGVF